MDQKKIIIAGNWKSNKSEGEVKNWFEEFAKKLKENSSYTSEFIESILFVPSVYLLLAHYLKKKLDLPISLGAQNISPFSEGAYTGEVTAKMVSQYARFALIGHSERRKYFQETDELLGKKVQQAIENTVEPLYCIQDEKTVIPKGVHLVAYEPVWAIGSGVTDSPENANRIAEMVKKRKDIDSVLYGGSVTPENVRAFIHMPSLDGVLPGKGSLDPKMFWEIIQAAKPQS